MNNQKQYLIKQFNRYIKNVIMPTFPQLVDFEVVDWFPGNDLAYQINFYYDENPQDFVNHQVEDAISEMMSVFSIESIVYGVNFMIKE